MTPRFEVIIWLPNVESLPLLVSECICVCFENGIELKLLIVNEPLLCRLSSSPTGGGELQRVSASRAGWNMTIHIGSPLIMDICVLNCGASFWRWDRWKVGGGGGGEEKRDFDA